LVRRLNRAYSQHGLRGFLRLAARNLVYFAGKLSLSALRESYEERAFDRAHGVRTSGIRELGSLDLPEDVARHAVRYQPTDPDFFAGILSGLPLDFAKYSFIDYGSGKGRLLLLAAHHPFREVIGVEFSRELHRIAEDNIRRYRSPLRRCRRVRTEWCNAAHFQPPPGPLLCYFYNPFDARILQPVLRRIEACAAQAGEPSYVIYVDPVHGALLEAAGHWEPIQRHRRYTVYRRRALAGGESQGGTAAARDEELGCDATRP
jgi:SAM-dependent methyltransferase